jgi:hypothetical protein
MLVVVTKTNSDYWYQIRNIDSIEQLMKLDKCQSFVIQRNWWYKDDPKDIAKFWEGMTLEDAEIISTLPYEVEIYNDYRE